MTSLKRPDVISLTEAAALRVREIMENAEHEVAGLKIGIRNGGCAGMAYTLELVDAAGPGDEAVERDGARVFVDPKATLFLLGTELDYEETKLRSGFVFNNPNQTSACGCGESVTLNQADPAIPRN